MNEPATTGTHSRILVVDDQRSIRAFVIAVLQPLNTCFIEAGTGEEALDLIAVQEFDAVLLDINMPGMDGLEVCRRVRADSRYVQLPIIIMTAMEGHDIVAQAFASGATDYVHKPIHQPELLARTQAVISRRQTERALYYAKKEAENANRAKSLFISSMSHELRTPLNAVLGFAQLMETDEATPLEEEHREYVEQILGAGWYLLKLINDILDLSKIEAGILTIIPTPASVNDLVQESISYNQNLAAQHGIGLEFTPNPTNYTVLVDEVRFRQVLINLISNAIKYNRPDGSVTVAVNQSRPGRVQITVTDTGPGIPQDKMSGLFQPFNRLGAELGAVEGSGIGLALAKRIVEHMQGYIGVKSEIGVGCTFWVEFDQCFKESESDDEQDNAVVTLSTERNWDILCIEDNVLTQRLVADLLKRRPNFRLHMAATGAEGLSMATASPPDLIILDINLPDMSGFEVFAQLKDRPETMPTPVLGVSARAMKENVDKALHMGFCNYLTKPFSLQELNQAIDRCLA